MSAATLFTGLDLHKRTVVATTLNAAGEQVAHEKLPCHPEALRFYFARQNNADAAHRAVVEATNGWYWVKDALAEVGVDLRLAHAKHVKAITAAKVKPDTADALTLAQLLRVDMLRIVVDPLKPTSSPTNCGRCATCCGHG